MTSNIDFKSIGAWSLGWDTMAQTHVLSVAEFLLPDDSKLEKNQNGVTLQLSNNKYFMILPYLRSCSAKIESMSKGYIVYITYLVDKNMDQIYDDSLQYPSCYNEYDEYNEDFEHEYHSLESLFKEIKRIQELSA